MDDLHIRPESVIHDAARVIAVYGAWPSFHDFEIVRLVFDRHLPGTPRGPHITAYIHMWQICSRTAGQQLRYAHHRIVGVQFRSVVHYRVAEFNHQNVIDDLAISQATDDTGAAMFDVVLPGIHGVELAVRCRSIHIVSVDEQLPVESVYRRDEHAP